MNRYEAILEKIYVGEIQQDAKNKIYKERHRFDNEPTVVYPDGVKFWWINGKRQGYFNGLLHRLDGPAYIWKDGYQEWYLNGIQVDEEIYQKIQNSSKEELLVYMVNPEYKDYISLIEYRLNL